MSPSVAEVRQKKTAKLGMPSHRNDGENLKLKLKWIKFPACNIKTIKVSTSKIKGYNYTQSFDKL